MHIHSLSILLISLVVSATSCATKQAQSLPRLSQTIDQFHRPESVVFSLDGKTLFVGNCASDLFGPDRKLVGMVKGEGAISKLSVSPEGNVVVQDLKFIEGLNSPLGLAVMPQSTDEIPRGTLLVNQGITLLVSQSGEPVTDARALGTGVKLFDPSSGSELGSIELGVGSRVAEIIGHPLLLPNSLAFDSEGNLFITDTAKGGDRQVPPQPANPGLIRITSKALDLLVAGRGEAVTASDVSFLSMPGVPNGVGYWPAQDAICVVTMGGEAPEGTAIYQIPATSFPRRDLPEPWLGNVGTADGVAFTPAGTVITSRFAGDLLAIPRRGNPFPLNVPALVAPADHRLLTLADGSSILAVPEQARTEPKPWSQRVRIIRIPEDF